MMNEQPLVSMQRNAISWFKHGYAYDARFTGFKTDLKYKVPIRCWQRITVFVYENDRQEAIREVQRAAAQYGYQNVTVDHMVRIN